MSLCLSITIRRARLEGQGRPTASMYYFSVVTFPGDGLRRQSLPNGEEIAPGIVFENVEAAAQIADAEMIGANPFG